MKQTLTGRYCLHQMAYWASAAGVISFASAFLLEKGFIDMICDRRELKKRLADILRLHGREAEA